MLCRSPFVKDGKAHGCGQCMPCRLNSRRVWTHRILLEALCHPSNAFVTLTYSDENLPRTPNGYPTLVRADYVNFIKRLRKAYAPERFRMYLVGEYGDDSSRPHYHAALFNFPRCSRGRTLRRPGSSRPLWAQCCPACQLVGNQWSLGDVDLGSLEPESAQYLCGYVTKKMTRPDDTRLPPGVLPEFAQPSLRPGVGQLALHEVASQLMAFNLEDSEGDVPSSLRHGTRLLPLGRYLRRELRKMVGKEPNAPQATLDQMEQEMSVLREAAFNNSRSFKSEIIKNGDQAVKNMEAKQRIYKQRKTL